MKKLLLCIMFLLSFVGFAATTVSADGPAKPVIEGENPKSEPVTPKADQKHEKIFYRCPHPKAEQNYLDSKICYN